MLDRFLPFVTQAAPLPSSLSALAAGLLALICTRTKRRVRRLGALAGLLLASAGVTAAPALRTLNVPGADFTQARGTNGSGQIPGWYLHGFSAVQVPLLPIASAAAQACCCGRPERRLLVCSAAPGELAQRRPCFT